MIHNKLSSISEWRPDWKCLLIGWFLFIEIAEPFVHFGVGLLFDFRCDIHPNGTYRLADGSNIVGKSNHRHKIGNQVQRQYEVS